MELNDEPLDNFFPLFDLEIGSGNFEYALIPSEPPSLPKPLSLYPPKPHEASNKFVEFIQMTPAFTFGAISKAKLIFSDQILAASPYGVLFAMDTASLGVLNVIVVKTGPNIST